LIDHLGIKKLLAVLGGSMGGMQVLQWAVSYPDMMQAVIPIATACQFSPQNIAFDWVAREAIKADPNWNGGEYTEDNVPARGLAAARMLAHITYLSEESMSRKFGRSLQNKDDGKSYEYDFDFDFKVESYLQYQGQRFVERFDANSYLYLTKAMDMYDLTEGGKKTLASEFSNVNKKVLIISFTSDWHFTPADSWEMAKELARLGKNVSYINIESSYGHDSFLLPNKMQEGVVKSFLRNLGDKA
jgi:homoserine O-acetyltransferase